MDLSIKLAVFAAFVQVILTLVAIVRMGLARVASIKRKDLHVRDIAVRHDAWSDDIKKLQNNVTNQFETPILLYAAVAIMAAFGVGNWVMAICAVVFVGLRIVHHLIHTGSNSLGKRFKVFTFSLLILAIMWLALLVDVIRL